jgi:hypothetical protein
VLVDGRWSDFSAVFPIVLLVLLLLRSNGTEDETPCLEEYVSWCGFYTNPGGVCSLVDEDLVAGQFWN